MAQCNWPMDGRRCRGIGPVPFLSDLVLCYVHKRLFLSELRHAIHRPEDRHEEEIQVTAQDALRGFLQDLSSKPARERQARSVVYFIERAGFIKIGFSSDLRSRMQAISRGDSLIDGMTAGPVRILATIERSGRPTEGWLHRRFAHLRIGGEWFLPEPELLDFIEGLQGHRGTSQSLRVAAR